MKYKVRICKAPGKKMAYGGQTPSGGLDLGQQQVYEGLATPSGEEVRNTLSPVPRELANIEAEKGETALADFDRDGQLEHMKIQGKRHSQGGTPLSVPEGTFIFSDAKKMQIGGRVLSVFGKSAESKKKYTPAQLAKQYELNKYKAVLDDPDADPITRKTAEMMLQNNEKKLAQLALVQEAQKGFPNGIPQIAMPALQTGPQGMPQARLGGEIPRMADGGPGPYGNARYVVFTDQNGRQVKIDLQSRSRKGPTSEWRVMGSDGKSYEEEFVNRWLYNTQSFPKEGQHLKGDSYFLNGVQGGVTGQLPIQTQSLNPSAFRDALNKGSQALQGVLNYTGDPTVDNGFMEPVLVKAVRRNEAAKAAESSAMVNPRTGKITGVPKEKKQKGKDEYTVADPAYSAPATPSAPATVPDTKSSVAAQVAQNSAAPGSVASANGNGQTSSAAVTDEGVNPGDFNPVSNPVPFGYQTPDKLRMMQAAANFTGAKKYLPWEAPMNVSLMTPTYFDPSRELASNSEMAAQQMEMNALFAGPQAMGARNSAVAGAAAQNAANILGKYGNMNVQIANQTNAQNTELLNREAEYNVQRANRLYQGNVTANQQFDNSKRMLGNELVGAAMNAWKNRQQLDLMNNTSQYFYIDPATGQFRMRQGKSLTAKGAGSSGEGNTIQKLAERTKYYKDTYKLSDAVAKDLAEKELGIGRVTTQTKDPFSQMRATGAGYLPPAGYTGYNPYIGGSDE